MSELDRLANDADALGPQSPSDTSTSAGAQVAEPVPISPNIGPLVFLLTGFRELTCVLLDVTSPKRTLADPAIEALSKVLAPCADAAGFNIAQAVGGPWFPAAMTAGPILWAAYRELDQELTAKRAKPVNGDAATQADTMRTGSDAS